MRNTNERPTLNGGESPAPVYPVDRSACLERVCTCHDPRAWAPHAYLAGCSSCGCRHFSTLTESEINSALSELPD